MELVQSVIIRLFMGLLDQRSEGFQHKISLEVSPPHSVTSGLCSSPKAGGLEVTATHTEQPGMLP
jgi:hypothetical protein